MTFSKTWLLYVWQHFMQDSLRRNSSLLIVSQTISAGSAFLFWAICAHLFTAHQLGLATAFISFGALISTFTNLGLPNTIIRFLPTSHQQGRLFVTSLYAIITVSLIGSLIAITCIKLFVPKLDFVQSSPILSITLVLLITSTSISALLDGTLMAFRQGKYILIRSIIINIPRVLLPFCLVSLAMTGIVITYVGVSIIGIIYSLNIILYTLLRHDSLKADVTQLNTRRHYAAGNYFGAMFGVLPGTLTPIIILNQLGPEAAAYFYIPMQISAFFSLIASSVAQALIAESAQTEDIDTHRLHFRNALRHLYQMLTPAVCIISLVAWPLLHIYGTQYAHSGFAPLLILAIASLLIGINWLGDTWLNIEKRINTYFFMNAFNAILVVGSVYILTGHGLTGAAIGWLIGQIITAIVYLILFTRDNLLSSGVTRRKSKSYIP